MWPVHFHARPHCVRFSSLFSSNKSLPCSPMSTLIVSRNIGLSDGTSFVACAYGTLTDRPRPPVSRPRDRVPFPSLLTLILPFFLDLVPGKSVHTTSALGNQKGGQKMNNLQIPASDKGEGLTKSKTFVDVACMRVLDCCWEDGISRSVAFSSPPLCRLHSSSSVVCPPSCAVYYLVFARSACMQLY